MWSVAHLLHGLGCFSSHHGCKEWLFSPFNTSQFCDRRKSAIFRAACNFSKLPWIWTDTSCDVFTAHLGKALFNSCVSNMSTAKRSHVPTNIAAKGRAKQFRVIANFTNYRKIEHFLLQQSQKNSWKNLVQTCYLTYSSLLVHSNQFGRSPVISLIDEAFLPA